MTEIRKASQYIGTYSKSDIAKRAELAVVNDVQSDSKFPTLKYTNYRDTKDGRIEVWISSYETPFTK